MVRAAVDRRVRAARALPAGGPLGLVGGPDPGRGAGGAGGVGRSATTRASGTTRPASWRCSTTSSGSAALLRDGGEPFHPDRDRLAFARYLIELGCQPPPGRDDMRASTVRADGRFPLGAPSPSSSSSRPPPAAGPAARARAGVVASGARRLAGHPLRPRARGDARRRRRSPSTIRASRPRRWSGRAC